MSIIGTQQQFKSSSRSPRTVNTEETFTGGMHYTDNPLMDNYAKLLVNYDIDDSGSVLSPRPGLRMEDEFECNYGGATESSDWLPDGAFISNLKRFHKRDMAYTSIILGQPVLAPLYANAGVYYGDAYTAILNESSKNYVPRKLLGAPHYIRPQSVKMHDMDLAIPLENPKVIGTFAWNGDYYYFADIDMKGKLCKAAFDEVELCMNSSEITPKALEPTQVTNGYNMLLEDPYDFTCAYNDGMGDTILLTGLLPYTNTEDPKLCLKPRVGDAVKFHLFYAIANKETPTGYKFTFEWSEPTSGTWNTFGELDYKTGVPTKGEGNNKSPAPIVASLQGIPDKLVYIRATSYKYVDSDSGKVLNDYPESVVTYTLDLTASVNITQFSEDLPNYTLTNAKGLCYWADRLVCYGCPEDPNMLFVSDLRDPTYFPYPNNIDTFDEPIMYVTPYLKNNLLVFTKTQLYMLTLSADYLSWTQTLIQSNLDITEWDLNCVQIVKNMVLFKSGSYYYMVVPKMTSSTGLTIAPISRNMEKFFDNFEQSIKDLFSEVYNYTNAFKLTHYYNYLDYEAIHNVYLFRTNEGVLVNVDLIYNSNKRYWKVYVYESSGVLTPFVDNATDRGSLLSIADNTGLINFQAQKFSADPKQKKDSYRDRGLYYDSAQIFKNYQYINTGYREIASNLKKRFRELQFELDNTSQTALKFYVNFYIDGDPRRYCYKGAAESYYDTKDKKNYVVFSQQLDEGMANKLPSTTALDLWALNESLFPEAYFWKIRVPVSGKGYTPQMQILSQNEEAYDLLNISWVYRMMYTR